MDFLENVIFTRFGVPSTINIDNVRAFSSLEITTFCFYYSIVLSHSSNYYPQGNLLSNSSNNNLMAIIKRTVGNNKKSWDKKIKCSLWDDKITKKDSIGKSPFELVYIMDVILPILLNIPIFKLMQQYSIDSVSLQQRINQIMELDESPRHAHDHLWKN